MIRLLVTLSAGTCKDSRAPKKIFHLDTYSDGDPHVLDPVGLPPEGPTWTACSFLRRPCLVLSLWCASATARRRAKAGRTSTGMSWCTLGERRLACEVAGLPVVLTSGAQLV